MPLKSNNINYYFIIRGGGTDIVGKSKQVILYNIHLFRWSHTCRSLRNHIFI